MSKVDGLSRITGQARYVADLKLPRMAHAKLLRSPHAHARIVSIDVSAALALPGVYAVMTGEDLPRRYGAIPVAQDETALALGKVRYIGEPVACVAALDEETALRACNSILVTYDVLPACFTVAEAMTGPLIHDEARKPSNVLRRVFQDFGDVDAGMAAADVVIESEYDYPGSTHVPLEPHGALAAPDPDGKLTLWTSTQNLHYVHKDVARVLGMREQDLRVIKPAVGAGYGGKCDPFATELCASFLARKLNRPVRLVFSREEVFYAHRGRHPTKMWLKMGLTRDGEITAIDFKAWADGGAYASYGVVTSYYLGVFMTLPYRLGAYRFEAFRLYTNKPPCGPKRGHGAIQPRFALEVHLDKAAAALGIEPGALRRRNLLPADCETLNGLKITSNGAQECLDTVIRASGYDTRTRTPGRGMGLALSAYMCGALHPVHPNEMSQSTVQIKVDRSGEVTLFSGTSDIGQGSTHMLAELCSRRLGIAPRDVRVIEGDTSLTPVDLGSYSSRVTFMAGNACLTAANELRAKLCAAVAAKTGATEVTELEVGDGNIGGVSFVEAVQLAEEMFGPLGSIGGYKPPKIGSRFRRQSVGPSPAYSFTAQVAEVRVDEETGVVTVERIWCAHDCGFAIHRTLVEGQIEGCVYMGVGEAMSEEQTYRNGVLRAPSILEYKIPTVHETPEIHALIVESIDPGGPLGAKEAGEGPQLSTVPAIANAIHDAVGIRLDTAPFTPDRVLRALERRA